MHGRLKVKDSAEKAAEKALDKEKKRKQYLAGSQLLFQKRKDGYDTEALHTSALLLVANPDDLTLWNVRREILLQLRDTYKKDVLDEQEGCQEEASTHCRRDHRADNSASDVRPLPSSWPELITAELTVVSTSLQTNPKSYGAWHHRSWVMQQQCCAASPEDAHAAWGKELALCDLFLTKDERNFHCWDYRRIVVERGCVSSAQELQFSLALIERNFSNFSAWHYRSKLLPLLYPPSPRTSLPLQQAVFHKELERVVSAVFTDPGDQSPWFFLRWLLQQQQRQPQLLQLAVCERFDGKLEVICSFTSPVEEQYVQAQLILSHSDANEWRSASRRLRDTVWICELKEDVGAELRVKVNDEEHLVPVIGGTCSTRTFTRRLLLLPSPATAEILQQLLHDCDLLHQLDASNKWVLLSLVEILCALNGMEERTRAIEILGRLCHVDALRAGYYTDRKSSLLLEEVVTRYLDGACDTGTELELNLSKLGLKRLHCPQLLACTPRIDLSNNYITSLAGAGKLRACSVLILDGNPVECLDPLRQLIGLRVLSLASCGLRRCDALTSLSVLPALLTLNLKCNDFLEQQIDLVQNAFKHIRSLEL